MKIEHGKFYITRGGDKVGPAYRHEGRISEETWQIGDQWYDDQGVCSTGTPFVNDVVALHVQEYKGKPTVSKAASLPYKEPLNTARDHLRSAMKWLDGDKPANAIESLGEALRLIGIDMQRNEGKK